MAICKANKSYIVYIVCRFTRCLAQNWDIDLLKDINSDNQIPATGKL